MRPTFYSYIMFLPNVLFIVIRGLHAGSAPPRPPRRPAPQTLEKKSSVSFADEDSLVSEHEYSDFEYPPSEEEQFGADSCSSSDGGYSKRRGEDDSTDDQGDGGENGDAHQQNAGDREQENYVDESRRTTTRIEDDGARPRHAGSGVQVVSLGRRGSGANVLATPGSFVSRISSSSASGAVQGQSREHAGGSAHTGARARAPTPAPKQMLKQESAATRNFGGRESAADRRFPGVQEAKRAGSPRRRDAGGPPAPPAASSAPAAESSAQTAPTASAKPPANNKSSGKNGRHKKQFSGIVGSKFSAAVAKGEAKEKRRSSQSSQKGVAPKKSTADDDFLLETECDRVCHERRRACLSLISDPANALWNGVLSAPGAGMRCARNAPRAARNALRPPAAGMRVCGCAYGVVLSLLARGARSSPERDEVADTNLLQRGSGKHKKRSCCWRICRQSWNQAIGDVVRGFRGVLRYGNQQTWGRILMVPFRLARRPDVCSGGGAG